MQFSAGISDKKAEKIYRIKVSNHCKRKRRLTHWAFDGDGDGDEEGHAHEGSEGETADGDTQHDREEGLEPIAEKVSAEPRGIKRRLTSDRLSFCASGRC